MGYMECSSICKPNCLWLKIKSLKNIYMNISVGIIQNEPVWLRIRSFEMEGNGAVIVPELG